MSAACTGLVHCERFRSMGVNMEVHLDCPDPAVAASAMSLARIELERLVRIFSRFDETSEISRYNRDPSWQCSPELGEVLDLAFAARSATRGRFDPTLLAPLVAAGYDDDLEVVLARDGRTVPTGYSPGIDLGGIAKGWIADRLAEMLAATGPALVNAGGDIALTSRPHEPWVVGVPTPAGELHLALAQGGVATSGTDRRRWRTRAGWQHHLIDPRTRRPVRTDLTRVTVVAGDCAQAEVNAKRLLLAGREAAIAEAFELHIPAVLIGTDDSITLTGDLA
jgi:FAD:protein FMN transferase